MVKLQITVTEDQLMEAIKSLVLEIDYDVWKQYEHPECEGDPDWIYLYSCFIVSLNNPPQEDCYAETEEGEYALDGEAYEYIYTTADED